MGERSVFSDPGFYIRFLPRDWAERARDLGAMTRQRKFTRAEELLSLLLIHLGDGLSMRETVARGKKMGLVAVSDVALLKRLKLSSEWLRWMALKVMEDLVKRPPPPLSLAEFTFKSGFSCLIREPGVTGSHHRLYHCLNLVDLQSDQFVLIDPDRTIAAPFRIGPRDLLIGDSVQLPISDLILYQQHGGEGIVRLSTPLIDLVGPDRGSLLLEKAMKLGYGDCLDETLTLGEKMKLRMCILRVRPTISTQPEPGNAYNSQIPLGQLFIVASTLPQSFSANDVLKAYRFRWVIGSGLWQLPIFLGSGHLPKGDEDSFHAWFHGKLLVALLAESIRRQAEYHTPWGYPLPLTE